MALGTLLFVVVATLGAMALTPVMAAGALSWLLSGAGTVGAAWAAARVLRHVGRSGEEPPRLTPWKLAAPLLVAHAAIAGICIAFVPAMLVLNSGLALTLWGPGPFWRLQGAGGAWVVALMAVPAVMAAAGVVALAGVRVGAVVLDAFTAGDHP
jgi:hypothetical protein